ncbi:hypothetical protein ILYODFUR_035388 [Ilyodon furcidens]|uniref:Uncharacterized protein n=1 Tax=Ilyodon furcidens TaxID=33524 RepID=A0ABV0VKF3_9TELE
MQRRAHRPCQQLSTPEQIHLWTQKPETLGHINPPSRDPKEPGGPEPGKQPPGASWHTHTPSPRHREPPRHQRAETPATGGEETGPHLKTPNVKTHNNGCRTRNHTPHTYSILQGPGTDTPGGKLAPGPQRWFPSLWGGDSQSAPAQTCAGTA